MGMYGSTDRECGIVCEPSEVKQGFKNHCDINVMVARYQKTGLFSNLNSNEPRYVDCTEFKGYRESLDLVIRAREAFEALDPKLRTRFHNDPAEMVAFCEDPSNLEEGIKLGFFKPKPKAKADTPEGSDLAPGGVGSPAPGGSGTPGSQEPQVSPA